MLTVADYFDSGFLFLQHRIDLGIIAALAPAVNITRLHVDMQRFPHPAYDTIEDGKVTCIGYMDNMTSPVLLKYALPCYCCYC